MPIARQLFFVLILSSSFSDARGMPPSDFERLVRIEVSRCPSLNCENSRVTARTMTTNEKDRLSPEMRNQMNVLMQEVAFDQWPDTILESSVVTEFETAVDGNLKLVLIAGRPQGFQIPFSAKAWDLDYCKAGQDEPVTFDEVVTNCQPGRIYHRGFANGALTHSFEDPTFEPTMRKDRSLRRSE